MWSKYERFIKFFISACFWFGCLVLNGLRRMVGRKIPPTFVILYYHAVTQGDRNRFTKQIEDMTRLAKFIPVDSENTLIDGVHHIAITFDDGFRSVSENALPELIKRRIPIAIFIPTGYIGRKTDWIEDKSHEDRCEMVMTEEEIKRLPEDLVTLGSHSVSHPNLRLIEEDTLRRELIESKEKLQLITGRKITLMSIPYGEYDERIVEVALQVGYRRVFSSLPRLIKKREYVVERVPVRPSDWTLEFRLKVLGAYQWLPFALVLKRKVCSVMIKDLKR
jgi:peptidoglycan/xylan/chitin deacetylase (PgdA/CDA1 family)